MASNASPAAASSPSNSTTLVLQQPARIGLVADEMAHADELAAAGAQPLERARGGIRIGQRQPADHAAHEIDLLAEIEAFLGLAADLMQDLDQHGPLDAAALELGAQVVGREIAREAVAGEHRASDRLWRPVHQK